MGIQGLNKVYGSLDKSYKEWEPHFRDVAQAFDPSRNRFDKDDVNKKRQFNSMIIDPEVTMCARTLAGGMQSGVTNQSVPWISLKVDDPELNQFHSVKMWNDQVAKLILDWLAKSNFYNMAPSVYRDMGLYSTASVLMQADSKTLVRFYHQPVGAYRVANGARLDIDHWARELKLTPEQMIRSYGIENVSKRVREAYDKSDYNTVFDVRQLIMPREDYNPLKMDAKNKPYMSVAWEPNKDDSKDTYLRESGFNEFPAATPRWDVIGNDSWGSFGPGMLGLGSARGLQKDQLLRYKAQDMMVDPPMNVPASMKNSIGSGGVVPGRTYFTNTNEKVESAVNIGYRIDHSLNSIVDTRNQLKSVFFNDLFMSITNIDKSNATATEIARRNEESLLMLGPVLSNINEDFLDQVVMFTFKQLSARGMLPEAPQEMQGKPISIEYVSMLHQAQKIAGITSIEKTVGFIGNLVGMFPNAADLLNVDGAIREYQSIVGSNPVVLNSEDVVEQTRQQRAQAAQQQQMAAAAQPMREGAQAAKLLSETDSNGQNMLDVMRSNLGAVQ